MAYLSNPALSTVVILICSVPLPPGKWLPLTPTLTSTLWLTISIHLYFLDTAEREREFAHPPHTYHHIYAYKLII